jgi:signal transduction histidine kinase
VGDIQAKAVERPVAARQIRLGILIFQLLLLAACLCAAGGAVHLWGAIYRPDLRFRLTSLGGAQPPEMVGGMSALYLDQSAGKQVYRLLKCSPQRESYNEETGRYSIRSSVWLESDKSGFLKRELEFEFPGRPQSTIFRLNDSYQPMSPNVVITAVAAYEDRILLQVISLNCRLETMFLSKTEVPIPYRSRGASVNLGSAIWIDMLNTPRGRQDYLAVGLSLGQSPARELRGHKDELGRDKSMEQKLGIVVVPAQQADWGPPYKVIPFPVAPHIVFEGPFGWPGVFAWMHANGNGWFSNAPPEILEKHPELAAFYENDDSWSSFYIVDMNSGLIKARLKLMEDRPEFRWPCTFVWGRSNRPKGLNTREIQILGFASRGLPPKGLLFNYRSELDYASHKFSFVPEGGEEIEYAPVINDRFSLEDSRRRLGFVLFNEDGSAGFLLQPDWLGMQKVQWIKTPPESAGSDAAFKSFLGILGGPGGEDYLLFGTDSGYFLAYRENGDLVCSIPASRFFINDDSKYILHRATWEQSAFDHPVYVRIEGENRNEEFGLILNPRFIPQWKIVLNGTWSGLAALWLIGGIALVRRAREKAYVPPEVLDAVIEEEREARDLALDEAYEQHTAQARGRLGQIADSLAHSLNTPLDAIRATLELLRSRSPIEVASQLIKLFPEPELSARALALAEKLLANPPAISISETNRRTDEFEELLAADYPGFDRFAKHFARTGFEAEEIGAFIETFGRDRAGELVRLLDEIASERRGILLALSQHETASRLVNRLRHLIREDRFDVRLSLETSLQMLEAPLTGKKIKVSTVTEDVPRLKGDPLLMVEIIGNILTNAVEALPEYGEIKVSVTRTDDKIELAISNNGPAIPADVLPRVFERGFTAGKPQGTGLGLFIAAQAVRILGGSIAVSSTTGCTEFKMEFPIPPSGEAV